MDYSSYHFSLKERLVFGGLGIGLLLLVALLVYRSLWVMLAAAVFLPFWYRLCRRYCVRKRRQELCLQFRESMQSVSAALLAGYSLENAWRESEKDMRLLYGDNAYICQELHHMNAHIGLQQNLEVLLEDFGQRSGLEDVISFCQVMQFAKRSGGNFSDIIGTTVRRIGDKIEINREIETVIAAKRLESGIMNLVPALILVYLTFASPGYLDVLYHNAAGVVIMSAALVVYGFGVWLSVRLVQGVEL